MLIFRIIKAPIGNGESGLILGKVRTVVDLGYPHLPPALPQGDPGGGGVGDDVAADGLLRVRLETGNSITTTAPNIVLLPGRRGPSLWRPRSLQP